MATTNQERLDLYLAAEEKILGGQSVQFGDRRLQYADLEYVQKQITRLQSLVARETATAGGRRGGRFSQANFGGCG